MKTCAVCNVNYDDDIVFCKKCGLFLQDDELSVGLSSDGLLGTMVTKRYGAANSKHNLDEFSREDHAVDLSREWLPAFSRKPIISVYRSWHDVPHYDHKKQELITGNTHISEMGSILADFEKSFFVKIKRNCYLLITVKEITDARICIETKCSSHCFKPDDNISIIDSNRLLPIARSTEMNDIGETIMIGYWTSKQPRRKQLKIWAKKP